MLTRFTVLIILISSVLAFGAEKGITFQAVLKKPDGTYPTVSGLTVTLQILDPNTNCVLREEEHSGINISNGYINLIIGSPAATTPIGRNPSPLLSLAEIMDNATPRTNLTCVDGNNNTVATGQTYTPTNADRRKLRLRAQIGPDLIVADFNMRSVPFAVNSETLNGKTESNFIQVTTDVTQAKADALYAPGVYDNIISLSSSSTSAMILPSGTTAQRPGTPTTGMFRFNSTTGNVEFYNGTAWSGVGAGSITSITAADTTITVGGTASAPTVKANVGTTAGTVAAGDDSRIVGAIQNTGNTPSIQTGAEASKPAMNGSGRLYISSDGQRIYRDDNSVGWSIVGTRDYNDLINKPSSSNFVPSQTGNAGKFLTTDGTTASWAALSVPWSSVTSTPTTISGYGITDALKNFGNSPGVMADITANKPAPNAITPGKIFVDTTTLKTYRDNGLTWDLIGTLNYLDLANKPTADSLLPSQTGNAGKVLSTNGTTISWVAGGVESTTVANVGTGSGIYRDMTGAQINLKSVLGTANQVSVTANPNDLTLSLPQNIHSGASPTFTGLILSGLTTAGIVKNNASGVLSGGNTIALGTDVSGTLPIANGGTNSSAALNNNRIMVSSAGAIVEAGALANGQLLIGSTGAAPVAASIAGTANQIAVTNGAGTITLSTPQNIDSAAIPTFGGMTLNGTLNVPAAGFNVTQAAAATGDISVTTTNNKNINLNPNGTGTVIMPSLRVTSGTLAAGKVLTSDAFGNASWAAPSTSGTVTSVTSANVDIGVATTTTTPVLTLNSGVAGGAGDANKIAKLNASGLLATGMLPTVPVANGGTGLTSISANQLVYASAANTLAGLAAANSSVLITNGTGVPSWSAISADTFNQYALLAGRAGGQTISGGNANSNNLTLDSTSAATKGSINLQPSGGNVGIGTTSPTAAKLTIVGTSVGTMSSQTNISAFNANGINIQGSVPGASQDAITYLSGSSGGGAAVAFGRNGWDTFLSFYTNPSTNAVSGGIAEVMRLNGVGNLGLGTNLQRAPLDIVRNDSTQAQVHVGRNLLDGLNVVVPSSNMVQFVSGASYESSTWTGRSTASSILGLEAGILKFYSDATTSGTNYIPSERFRIDAGGNVGIGVGSPSATLHLKAGTASAGTAPLKLSSGIVLTTPETGAVEYDGTNLYFTDSTATRRTLATASSVSSSYLPLAGGTMSGAINMAGQTVNGATGASGNLTLDSTSNALKGNIVLNPSGGNIGVGTATPSANLHVSYDSSTHMLLYDGGIKETASGIYGAALTLQSTDISGRSYSLLSTGSGNYPGAGYFGIFDNTVNAPSSYRFAIDPTGNVGIGTYLPGAKLEVAGTIKITGGTPGAGKVLTSDASGLASWLPAAAGESTTVSNAGTGSAIGSLVGTAVTLKSFLGTANQISIANNASDLTFSLPQNIHTLATPSFAGLTLSGMTTAGIVKNSAAGVLSGGNSVALSTDVSGTLAVANGGTGQPSLTSGSILVGNGTTGITTLAAGATGNVIYASSPTAFTVGTPDSAGLVDKASAQTIAGAKAFSTAISANAGITSSGSLPLSAGGTNQNVTVTPSGTGYTILNGNVGVGTSSPLKTLHVSNGNTAGSGVQTNVQIGDAGTGAGPLYLTHNSPFITGNAYFNTQWNYGGGTGKPAGISFGNGLHFTVSNNAVGAANTAVTDLNEVMTIAATGNVGIGTSNAIKTLTLQGPASGNTMIFLQNSDYVSGSVGSGMYLGTQVASGNTYSQIQAFISGNSTVGNLALQPFGGYVGVGTSSPSAKLEVAGEIKATNLYLSPFPSSGQNNAVCYNSTWNMIGYCTSLTSTKDNIQDLDLGLNDLLKLRPVSFTWKSGGSAKDLGFLAEEVEQVHPILASHDNNGKLIGVRYNQMTSLLTKSVQELHGLCKISNSQLSKIEERVQFSERDIASLKRRINEAERRAQEFELRAKSMEAYLCGKDPTAPFCK